MRSVFKRFHVNSCILFLLLCQNERMHFIILQGCYILEIICAFCLSATLLFLNFVRTKTVSVSLSLLLAFFVFKGILTYVIIRNKVII